MDEKTPISREFDRHITEIDKYLSSNDDKKSNEEKQNKDLFGRKHGIMEKNNFIQEEQIEIMSEANEELLNLVRECKKTEEALNLENRKFLLFGELLTHDMRNYLQTALGNIGLLERKIPLVDSQKKCLEACKRQLTKGIDLINICDDLISSEPPKGRGQSSINLCKSMSDAVGLVECRYPEKDIKIEYDPSGEKLAVGNHFIESVLINLLENAVKHTPEDEVKIWIRIAPFEEKGEPLWEISIGDNGPGIPDKMKTEVFEKHIKSSSTGGSGLGLFIAKTIIEHFGGKIWVEDRVEGDPSKGCAFKILVRKY